MLYLIVIISSLLIGYRLGFLHCSMRQASANKTEAKIRKAREFNAINR